MTFAHSISVRNAQNAVKAKCTAEACFLHTMEFDDRPEYAKRLEAARIRRGFKTAKEATNFFGWSYDTYAQHENGTRGIGRAAEKYATAFRVKAGWLLTGDGGEQEAQMEIAGKAGAGPGGTVLFATGDGGFGYLPRPVGAGPDAKALLIEGDSMRGLANDGWIITYEDRTAPQGEHFGEPCVCWLEDERVLIKTPYVGRGPGLYDLESENAPTMRDVPVRYFALITSIMPRRAAARWVKRNPGEDVTDVKLSTGEA